MTKPSVKSSLRAVSHESSWRMRVLPWPLAAPVPIFCSSLLPVAFLLSLLEFNSESIYMAHMSSLVIYTRLGNAREISKCF